MPTPAAQIRFPAAPARIYPTASVTCVTFSVLLSVMTPTPAQSPWHNDMVHGGTGYWHTRFRVDVANVDEKNPSLPGTPVSLRVGRDSLDLAGYAAESLRVVSRAGEEHLFFLSAADSSRRRGPIMAGDVLEFAVDAIPAGATESVYVYADNPTAFDVDAFSSHFQNGGFEAGENYDTRPVEWRAYQTDAQHRALYLRSGERSGSRCVAHGVGPNAEKTWIQWRQDGIKVLPGRHYAVRGWLKHSRVDAGGRAGYYVHTYDKNGRMRVNRVTGYSGSSDGWRQVTIEFDSVSEDDTMTIGTVLHASSGQAWYDDVELEVSPGPDTVSVSVVGAAERRDLTQHLGDDAWAPIAGGSWRVRAEMRVLNFDPPEIPQVDSQKLVMAPLSRAVHMVRRLFSGIEPPYRVHVVDPDRGAEVPAFWLGNERLILPIEPDPDSEHRYFAYLAPEHDPSHSFAGYERLVREPSVNLVANPDFEQGGDGTPVPGWEANDLGSDQIQLAVDRVGIIGGRCLRSRVSTTAPPGWPGWRQRGLEILPSTTYLYGVAIKTDIDPFRAWGHFIVPGGFVSFDTGAHVPLGGGWSLYYGQVTSPPDCTSTEIHLTIHSGDMSGTARYDGVLLAEATVAKVTGVEAHADLRPPGLHAWAVNPLVKVFPDDPVPLDATLELSAQAARNEREAFQLAVRSDRSATVSVEATDLLHPSGYRLPPVEVFTVGTVLLDLPSSYYRSSISSWLRPTRTGNVRTDGWAGEWPDPLIPTPTDAPVSVQNVELEPGRTQAMWFRVTVPDDAPTGEYTGAVEIDGGPAPMTASVRFRVWDFALPHRPGLQVTFTPHFHSWDLTQGRDSEAFEELYRFMAMYRIGPGVIRPAPTFTYDAQSGVAMDAADWEELAELCLEELHMSAGFTPWFFYAFGWAYRPRSLFGHPFGTPEWDSIFSSAYREFMDLLDRRGWKESFSYYISDEPFCDSEKYASQVAEDLHHVSALARAVAPGVPVYSSTWRHCTNLDGAVTHWGIGQHGSFPLADMRERLEAGDELWFTTDGQQAIDTPYLATERLLPTYCFAYDVSGYEFWAFSWWTQDPWTHGWHQFIRQSSEGEDFFWVRYPNGDGYLAYPGAPLGREGLVPSIRLEAVREGVEDYEYYTFLQDLLNQNPGERDGPAEEALQNARDLVAIPNMGGTHSLSIMPDPDAIYEVRRELAREIERLSETRNFRRGDANDDHGTDLSDAVFVLNYLFLGGPPPTCGDSADTDDNGELEITDTVYLLNYLFLGGPALKEPFPACGPDPTLDELTCGSFPGCE